MNKTTTIQVNIKAITTKEQQTVVSENIQNSNAKIIHGLEMNWWHFRIRISLLAIICKTYPNPSDWILAFEHLIRLRKKFLGNFKLKKMARVNGKYYMGLYTPGWMDFKYKKFIVSELNYFKPVKTSVLRFNHVFLAITKKCALQCDHCYTWDILNQKESLVEKDLSLIIKELQSMGVGQIHLTGGEPLIKFDTLVRLLQNADKTSNFWINTSGFKLTDNHAKILKEEGLTGVFISLDHFDETIHNDFRKFKDAYYWATNGAKNAVSNQLVVALSLCVRDEFVCESNLMTYMRLAKELGVQFVQFLEPREVGHYKNKQVTLSQEKIEVLESFFIKMNFSDTYKNFPIINYHGYYQRRQGCLAGGNRSMYVDPDGGLNACPFCHTKVGNILSKDFKVQLLDMEKQGCPIY